MERVTLKAVRRVRPVSLLRVCATVRRLSRLAARLAAHQTNPEPAPDPADAQALQLPLAEQGHGRDAGGFSRRDSYRCPGAGST